MFGFDDARDAHQQVYNDDNQAKFSHEAIGGAAAFEGMRLFEAHQRKEGETVNHGLAKEMIAGLVGVEVDRLAETKGMDMYDREKAKRHATDSANNMYDQQYGQQQQYDPNQGQNYNYNY